MDGCFDGRRDFEIWKGHSRMINHTRLNDHISKSSHHQSPPSVSSPRTNLPSRISQLQSIIKMEILLVITSDSDFWPLFLIFVFFGACALCYSLYILCLFLLTLLWLDGLLFHFVFTPTVIGHDAHEFSFCGLSY
jgi:hypothetical protein